MTDEVKTCVDMRIHFFEEYYSVPDDLRAEMDNFIEDIMDLGNHCGNTTEFEQNFAKSGLSNRFNSLVSRCTPKARKMTKEEKRQSRSIAKDILYENREELAKDAVTETAGRIMNDAADRQLTKIREQMIADGTLADHTIIKNRIEDAGMVANFIGGIFKKKGGKK